MGVGHGEGLGAEQKIVADILKTHDYCMCNSDLFDMSCDRKNELIR